jgi:hypothetical protein
LKGGRKRMKKLLYVVFNADTEDNHPNYMPNWKDYGSNYDVNPPRFKWEWTEYWDELIALFRKYKFPVTWHMRVDSSCIKDELLGRFKQKILQLRNQGDEIGIHIHTLEWDGNIWKQILDSKKEEEIVKKSIELFRNVLGFYPKSSRMGWNTMSNSIMKSLEEGGILYDCSAVPYYYNQGMFGYRNNILDWEGVNGKPYNPSYQDYKKIGNMRIIECPISSLGKERKIFSYHHHLKIPKRLDGMLFNFTSKFISLKLTEKFVKAFDISPHTTFTISPYWSISTIRKIVDRYVKIAQIEGVAILNGYFHPCDIFNPKNSKVGINEEFKQKIEMILEYITMQEKKGVKVIPKTISGAVKSYYSKNDLDYNGFS